MKWNYAAPPPDDKPRGCFQKIAHTSKRIALGTMRVTKRNNPRVNDDTFSAYKCRHCGKWHIGHGRSLARES